MTIEQLTHHFFEVRNQVHLWHLQTTSYAEHKALNEFYDEWLSLADDFIETFSGRYRRVSGGMVCNALPYQEGMAYHFMVKEASYLLSSEVRNITPDSDLNNILDEMTSLANRTAYLLTLK